MKPSLSSRYYPQKGQFNFLHHQQQTMSQPIKERYEIPNEIPFPLRLHIMLQQTEIAGQASIVSWMPSGKSFRVHDREVFSKEILPEYFRSSNFRSFQRNLSVYQFSRIWSGPEKGAYFHENFVRHNRVLCAVMKRHVPHKKDHVTLDPSSSSKKVTSATETTTIQETTMARGGQADMDVADDKNADDGDLLLAETTEGSEETGAAEQKYSGEGTRTLVVSAAASLSSSSSTSFRKLPPPAATRALLQPEQPLEREPVVLLQPTTNRGLPLIAGSAFPLDASGIARVDHLPGVGILAPTSRTGENGSWSGSTSSSSYRGEATFAPDKDVAIYFGERDQQHRQGRRLRSNSAPASTFLQVYSANESGGFDLNQQDSTNTLSAAKVPTTFGSSRTSGGDRIVGRGVTTTSFTGSPPSSSSSDDDPFLLDRLWSQTVDATTSTTVASKENSSMEDSISRRRATRTFRDGSDDDRGRLLSSPQGIPYSDDKASSSEEPREGSSSSKDDGSSNNKHMFFTAAGDDAGGGGGMTSPSPEKEERRSRGPDGRRIKGPSSSNNQQGYSSSSGDDTASFLRDLW